MSFVGLPIVMIIYIISYFILKESKYKLNNKLLFILICLNIVGLVLELVCFYNINNNMFFDLFLIIISILYFIYIIIYNLIFDFYLVSLKNNKEINLLKRFLLVLLVPYIVLIILVYVFPIYVYNTGVIYLTFDDGPHITNTKEILEILDENNIKATFFVVNKDDDLNYLIKEAYEQGHTIGLHSYTHDYSYVYSSKDNYFEDLNLIRNKVEKIIGEKINIIRFPGGSSNSVSKKYGKDIMAELTKDVINKGYIYYDWSIDSYDSNFTTPEEQIYYNVVNNLKKNKSNIVLFHDTNEKTVSVLEDIIDYGKKNGYSFKKITIETPTITHKTIN